MFGQHIERTHLVILHFLGSVGGGPGCTATFAGVKGVRVGIIRVNKPQVTRVAICGGSKKF